MKINVGCGLYPHPDYLNIDNDYEVGAFVNGLDMRFALANAHQLPVDDGAAVEVYASHVLEHYLPAHASENGEPTTDTLLVEWRRVLRPGGALYVAVPDLLECCNRIISEERQRDQWLGMLYAYHQKANDVHHWAYTRSSLTRLIERHGFIVRGTFKPFIPNPIGGGFDCSGAHCLDDLGNEVSASLNLMAEKTG